MKTRSLLVATTLALMGSYAMAQNTQSLRLAPVKAEPADTSIPWVAQVSDWQQGAHVFQVADEKSALAATGWLAATDEELLIRLDVADPIHINTQSGDAIWNGDFVRIAVDGKGDGTAGGAKDLSGLFGRDDVSIGFALTPTGPQGFTYGSTDEKMAGVYPADLLKFSRDDAKKVTRYDIRIPWSRLATQPGVFPRFGIVVQVRNIDEQEQKEPVHIHWGDGANEPKPGLFKKVALGKPPRELIAAAAGNAEVWELGDEADMAIAIASGADVTISAKAGKEQLKQVIKGAKDSEVQRFVLSYSPKAAGEKLEVELLKAGEEKPVASISSEIMMADPIVRQFTSRMDELISRAEHPLFLRHLRSLKAMVESEWARATLYKKTNAALARETLGYIRNMAAGMEGDAGNWDSYAREGRPLFMAYVSRRDGTLQWYTITLPKGWDPAKSRDEQQAFPMFFELHGAGNPHYLVHPASQIGTGEKAMDLLGYDRPRTFAMIQRNGYHVFPYGRGNSGYRDIGETDVLEAYRDAHETVKIDPDRRYLYGFSMGGGGTWNLGSRTPDRWAAIAILGMGTRVGEWGQAKNVAQLPIFIWGGETDNIAFRDGLPKDIIARFKEVISKAGGQVEASTTPEIGHNYLGEVQERSTNWLQQHTRKRPAKFAFVADTDTHRGVWGITMIRDMQLSPFPQFDCEIEGQTVRLTTQGTPRLELDLGEDGLQMAGEVTVLLNGKEAYKGPAKTERPIRLPVAKD